MNSSKVIVTSGLTLALMASLGCSRTTLKQNSNEQSLHQIGFETKAPSLESPTTFTPSVLFGRLSLGGTNCEKAASETASVAGDLIQIPDFFSRVEFQRSGFLTRSTCNVAIPFETDELTGFAVTGIEVEQTFLAPEGTLVQFGGEIFVAGSQGVQIEDITYGKSDLEFSELKYHELATPLIVCGKAKGTLRLNLRQSIERQSERLEGRSDLHNLKIHFTPIDC